MNISFKLLLATLCALCSIGFSEAKANACLVTGESGVVDTTNCDNGSPQAGLPVHSATTTSKAGTTGLCNNVNVFADEKQAREYAKTHEYDSVEKPNGASCWVPKCTYTSDCSNKGSGKTCCKSLINDTCWHECDICKFNRIGGDYYPYISRGLADNCELINNNDISATPSIYSEAPRNYKIDRLTNVILMSNLDNSSVWTCDADIKTTIIDQCANQNIKAVNGYKSTTTINKICIEGKFVDLNNKLTDYCPLSAVVCDESENYYSTSERCEQESLPSGPCLVTRSFNGYADDECWHSARQCSDFGHDSYVTGDHNSLHCDDYPNTELKYYCPKGTTDCNADNAVELDGNKCGACECKANFNRIDDCYSFIYDIISGYYNAQKRCTDSGYSKTTNISGNCIACPYNAKFWNCN